MSRANVDGPRKVNVLVIAENLDSSMLQRAALQKAGCQWHFVQSREEMSRLLIHTKIDIVLSLDARAKAYVR